MVALSVPSARMPDAFAPDTQMLPLFDNVLPLPPKALRPCDCEPCVVTVPWLTRLLPLPPKEIMPEACGPLVTIVPDAAFVRVLLLPPVKKPSDCRPDVPIAPEF